MSLLEVTDMTVGYGRIEALHGISLSVGDGELVTLIGANGAGRPPPCGRCPGCVR